MAGLGPPTPAMGPWSPGALGWGGMPRPAALAAPRFWAPGRAPGPLCLVFCGGGPEEGV